MSDRIDQLLGSRQAALSLRAYRQDLLASNIANGDTPNYKAKDIDFASALKSALSGSTGVSLATTASGHISSTAGSGGAYGAVTQYRSEYQGSVDGNTVNMDIERAAFTENSLQMEALLTFIKNDLKELQTAIQGQ